LREGICPVLAVKTAHWLTPEKFIAGTTKQTIGSFPEVDFVSSTDNLQDLKSDTVKQEFVMQALLSSTKTKRSNINQSP